jgi:phosphonate transport system permease protein
VLALGLTYGGMLAKVYAEILESTDPAPARALRASGAGRIQALLYGLLPQAAKELTSYTVYRWECASAPRWSWALSAREAWASSWTRP